VTDKQIVLTTCGSEDEAEKIARHLIENRLAACVNIISGAKSIYRWQEKVESAQEWLLLVKTTTKKISLVRNAILKLHSYDVPEFIVLSIEDGDAAYLGWIADSVR